MSGSSRPAACANGIGDVVTLITLLTLGCDYHRVTDLNCSKCCSRRVGLSRTRSRSAVGGPRSEVRRPKVQRRPSSNVRRPKVTVRGSRFAVRGDRFKVRSSRFTVRNPRPNAQVGPTRFEVRRLQFVVFVFQFAVADSEAEIQTHESRDRGKGEIGNAEWDTDNS
jgi:hypothetical protein